MLQSGKCMDGGKKKTKGKSEIKNVKTVGSKEAETAEAGSKKTKLPAKKGNKAKAAGRKKPKTGEKEAGTAKGSKAAVAGSADKKDVPGGSGGQRKISVVEKQTTGGRAAAESEAGGKGSSVKAAGGNVSSVRRAAGKRTDGNTKPRNPNLKLVKNGDLPVKEDSAKGMFPERGESRKKGVSRKEKEQKGGFAEAAAAEDARQKEGAEKGTASAGISKKKEKKKKRTQKKKVSKERLSKKKVSEENLSGENPAEGDFSRENLLEGNFSRENLLEGNFSRENAAEEKSLKENSLKENSLKEKSLKEKSLKEKSLKENSVKEKSIKKKNLKKDHSEEIWEENHSGENLKKSPLKGNTKKNLSKEHLEENPSKKNPLIAKSSKKSKAKLSKGRHSKEKLSREKTFKDGFRVLGRKDIGQAYAEGPGVWEWFIQHKSLIIIWGTVCAVIAALVTAYWYVVTNYEVTTVYVDGNIHYSNEEIMNMVMTGPYGNNSLYLSMKYKDMGVENVPFVEKMDVNILTPDTIRISVYEKALAGYVEYLGRYMYFDKDGIVVESSKDRTVGIPQVTGLQFGYVILNEPLPVENDAVFKQILNITQLLDKYELTADKIYFDSDYDLTLYFGGVRVTLGSGEDLDKKIMRLQYILPELEGKKGTLPMEKYTEDTKLIPFRPD